MFTIIKNSKKSQARLGIIKTAHGELETPFFMPDATRAAIKAVSGEDISAVGLKAFVVNTYHLFLQPGMVIMKKAGGVHGFMDWQKPILSDSGGYQVFSLVHKNKKMGKIGDNGVEFRSPIDGSKHLLTPEISIRIQFDLGTDMVVCFDDCPPNDYDDKKLKLSVERTLKWAKRCKTEYDKQIIKRKYAAGKRPLLFGVVQGGANLKLRKYCTEELIKLGFDGLGYGARPVDAQGKFLAEPLRESALYVPENYIRFGLGIGSPDDIVRCVKMGWDIFDCVIPTREGRHGRLFSWNKQSSLSKKFYKTANINNAKFARNFTPINKFSKIKELRQTSKAYLYHLFKINDPNGQRLASMNNLEFYRELMDTIRKNIKLNII